MYRPLSEYRPIGPFLRGGVYVTVLDREIDVGELNST
jgi:hypothetical protein